MEEDGCDGDGSATALLQQLHQDFESLPSNFRKISKEAFFAMKENGLTPGLAKKLRSQLSGLSNDDKRQVVDAFPKLEFLFSGA